MKLTCSYPNIQDKMILQVHMQNVPRSYANGLRRALHADSPSIAIDKVLFYENTTNFHEEFLAHRLGLIPIVVPQDIFDRLTFYYQCLNHNDAQKDYFDPTSDSFFGCTGCMIRGRLTKRAPHNQTITVTDWDLIFDNDQIMSFTRANNLRQQIPIIKLAAGQVIDLVFVAYKGVGRVHAKWSPVAACPLVPVPQISTSNINSVLSSPEAKQFGIQFLEQQCPQNVFAFQNSELQQVHTDKCMYCDNCVRNPLIFEVHDPSNFMEMDGVSSRFPFVVQQDPQTKKFIVRLQQPVEIIPKEDEFILTIESLGAIEPLQILTNTFKELDRQMNEQIPKYNNRAHVFAEDIEGVSISGDVDLI